MTAAAAPTLATGASAPLRAGVDELFATDMSTLSGLEIAELLEAVEVQNRRLAAFDARLLAEVEQRGVAGEFGRTSATDLLVSRLRVGPGEAKARVSRARALAPRTAVSGEALPPLFPTAAAALNEGAISAAHASVVHQSMRHADRALAALGASADEASRVCEQMLVESARHEHPGRTRTLGIELVQRLDPDGAPPDELDDRARGFTLSPTGRGGATVTGRLNAMCAAVWQTVLDVLAAPRPITLDDGREERDHRTAEQRRADAVLEAGLMILRSGDLPNSGGVPATLIVSATVDDVRRAGGIVRTAHGELIGVDQVLALAGDLDVDLALLQDEGTGTGTGAVLAYGRARRSGSGSQRKAMSARDGAGCCFPRCSRPLAWTQAHHITRWEEGGATDVANMCLVCTHHHRLLDRGDWQVIMAADGRPSWIPPPWIGDRSPMRNTAHHPPALDFGEVFDVGVRRPLATVY